MKRTATSGGGKSGKGKARATLKKIPARAAKSKAPANPETDWAHVDALSNAEVHAAALADPDNPPLSKRQLARMQRPSLARRVRFALGLSQAEFSSQYELPVGSIRDWEQGRCEMDAATTGYYIAIEADPDGVHRARKKAKSAA